MANEDQDALVRLAKLKCTQQSPAMLTLPQLVDYCDNVDSILWSAQECGLYRAMTGDFSLFSGTRTFALYFKHQKVPHVGFFDSANIETNTILSRAHKGYRAHSAYGKWLVPRQSKPVKAALERILDQHNELVVTDDVLRYSTSPTGEDKKGCSQFEGSLLVHQILGASSAVYARALKNKGYTSARIFLLSPDLLMDHLSEMVEVRYVGMGGAQTEDMRGDPSYITVKAKFTTLCSGRGVADTGDFYYEMPL